MGITGTDVTRESADMILLDDHFSTIVKAVNEGRRIYDNILKFIKYLMTTNAGELWTLIAGPVLGFADRPPSPYIFMDKPGIQTGYRPFHCLMKKRKKISWNDLPGTRGKCIR